MAQVHVCRLCTNICSDSRSLYDANGHYTDVYQLTINFFHPMFLRVEPDVRNELAVLCFECWNHISGFHNFQQTVLLVQAKLLKDAEDLPAKIQPRGVDTQNVTVKEEEEFVSLSEVELTNNCAREFEVKKIYPNAKISTNAGDGHSLKGDEHVSISSDMDDLSDEFEAPVGVFIGGEFNAGGENSNNSFSELELIDLQSSSDNEHSIEPQNDIMSMPNTTNESLKSGAISKKKRKTLEQLDNVIAQWKSILECVVCRKPFPTFTLLQRHFREMHPSEECYIECCHGRFKYRCRLEKHIRIHLHPRNYLCKMCGKYFMAQGTLDRHMLYQHPTAADDLNIQDACPHKPATYRHKCQICGKAYKVPSALREHFTIHTGESIHQCAHCLRSFKYRSSLCHHLKNAHPEKANKTNTTGIISGCSHCPRTFTYRTGLYHHLRIHHPEEFAKRPTKKRKHSF